jgi:hypothetical protein
VAAMARECPLGDPYLQLSRLMPSWVTSMKSPGIQLEPVTLMLLNNGFYYKIHSDRIQSNRTRLKVSNRTRLKVFICLKQQIHIIVEDQGAKCANCFVFESVGFLIFVCQLIVFKHVSKFKRTRETDIFLLSKNIELFET